MILLLSLLLLTGSPGVAWSSALQQAAHVNKVGGLPWYEAPQATPPEVVAGGRPGGRFTQKKKALVKQDNASRNEGKTQCESCGLETVSAEQHKKGVTPPKNETHVDHVVPRAKGGTNDPENGQVLCRECNIKKGDNEQ
ncbi:HNH endonuclease [Stigmatella aurantiaca]|uniref:HNH endonuclease n=1 Tax=Stigmatella aurantiaca TaxID=41 RepID=UPI0015A6846A|nr:HNH endonuclease signature motif containing protein [Stigmatella aurantiaca]